MVACIAAIIFIVFLEEFLNLFNRQLSKYFFSTNYDNNYTFIKQPEIIKLGLHCMGLIKFNPSDDS